MVGLRKSSRAVAFWLLFVSLWGLPHRGEADDVCAPLAAEVHDESKHVVTNATRADGEEHCAVCHWLRSLKPEPAVRAGAAVPRGPEARLALTSGVDRREALTDQLPARAPPSTLHS